MVVCFWQIRVNVVPSILIDPLVVTILSKRFPPDRFASTRHSVTGGPMQLASAIVGDSCGQG